MCGAKRRAYCKCLEGTVGSLKETPVDPRLQTKKRKEAAQDNAGDSSVTPALGAAPPETPVDASAAASVSTQVPRPDIASAGDEQPESGAGASKSCSWDQGSSSFDRWSTSSKGWAGQPRVDGQSRLEWLVFLETREPVEAQLARQRSQ